MLNVRGVDPNDGQVRLGIGPDHPRGKDARIVQGHLDFMCSVDHVAVREDEAISRHDEPRAASRTALAAKHANVYHRRRDAIYDSRNRPGIGIEKLGLAVAGRPGSHRGQIAVAEDWRGQE